MSGDTFVEKWFSTRDQKITWAISLAFFIIFPIYFANLGSFLPDNAMITDGSNVIGDWEVTFEETDVVTSESTETLMDGEEFVFEFEFNDVVPNLAYVEITVSHGETDESGNFDTQCDNAVGEMRMGNVEGWSRDDSTREGNSGSPDNCPTSYTMVIVIMENYTGEPYESSGSNGEILNMWNDNGDGRGEYRCQITLETRTGSSPGPSPTPGPIPDVLENSEDGEDITVSWRVVGVEVTVTPVVDISVS
ncbi:MAG: hypothetical protein VX473_04005 [Candidatus Thermoplasmatota archaeon]|nr:hypothetical protein [Candidatus Thermoplasmatota archaeon]